MEKICIKIPSKNSIFLNLNQQKNCITKQNIFIFLFILFIYFDFMLFLENEDGCILSFSKHFFPSTCIFIW